MSEATQKGAAVTLSAKANLPAAKARMLSTLGDREALIREVQGAVTDATSAVAKAREYADLYREVDAIATRADDNRTVTGAYVTRLMAAAGKAKGDTAKLLGVTPSRVTQYGRTATLWLDLGILPTEPLWAITRQEQNSSAMTKILAREDLSRAIVEEHWAAVQEAARLAKLSAKERRELAAASGDAESTEPEPTGSGDADSTTDTGTNGTGVETTDNRTAHHNGALETYQSNPKRLDHLEALVASLGSLSPGEWARLATVHAAIEYRLDNSPAPTRTKGQALYGKWIAEAQSESDAANLEALSASAASPATVTSTASAASPSTGESE